ncbi:MAG: tyrosine-type recombinase/integrase [Rhodospirillaceae bacterium]|nr:tyrosine-type recombinase/integrase [Rhodospirillaceae bacterium]MDE0615998.1 tyrosine-type recombinase/integrase [Rhodospirillaceae bacterium]
MIVKLKHVQRIRSKGRAYWYHRLTKERLPDNEEERIARVLHVNATLDGWRRDTIPGTLSDIIARYSASPDFKRLAPSTRRSYQAQLDLLDETAADTPIANIDARWLYEVRDAMADTPRSADMMLSVASILLNFAVARGYRQDNPARHVKKLRASTSYEPWPAVAIERFRADANPRLVWAMEIALYTGQRQSDVLAMQWNHIADGMIEVAQQKTGERLQIPIHPDLAVVLESIPRVGMRIVHRRDGRAYTPSGFRANLRKEMKRLGLQGLQFHGLRHTAGQLLAEAECSDREIMAILGHRTASMVTRYTRRADQKRLAKSAIVKLKPGTKV